MKRFFRNTLILTLALALSSCADILHKVDEEPLSEEKNAYITLGIGSSARTVLPDVTTDDFTYLELKGTVEGGTEGTLGSWESVAQMQQAVIPLSQGKWTFTLTAKIRVSAYTRATYESTIEKEIVLGENALSFELYLSNRASSGNGAFSITLSYAESQNADSVSYAIASLERYSYEDLVSGYEAMRLEPENNAVTFAVDSIKVDIFPYRAKITFYAEDGAVLATYRELVLVLAGKTSTATRTILIDNNANYEIRYELNGGNFAGGSLVPAVFNTKTPLTLTDAVEREHYTFAGWYTDENCTDGNEITTTRGRKADLTVYAKWSPCVYTVTFDSKGGNTVSPQSVAYGGNATEPEGLSTSSFAITGWYTSSDDGETLSDEPFDFTTPITSDITLYAKWKLSVSVISLTADTLSEITNIMMTCTVKVTGSLTYANISTIRSNLLTLKTTKPDVRIALDLSEADFSSLPATGFHECSNITSIIFPDTITHIYTALKGCTALESITVPSVDDYGFAYIFDNTVPASLKKVTVLGGKVLAKAFRGCETLTDITLADNVTYIAEGAFSGCSALESITIPFIGEKLFDDGRPTLFGYLFGTENYTGGVATTQNYDYNFDILPHYTVTYYIPSSLKHVTVGRVANYAFNNCTGLETITIYGSVSGYAFYNCTGIKTITLTEELTSFDDSGITGCTNLEAVYYEGTLEEWFEIPVESSPCPYDADLYINGSNLVDVEIPNGVTNIGCQLENCKTVETVIIPNTVSSISEEAFSGCSALKNLNIPDSVTSIGLYAFHNCTSLANINIGNSVVSIGRYAFANCTSLASITIPDSVTSIGGHAFANCTSLTSITIPDGVTSIGISAFSGCGSLEEITIPFVGGRAGATEASSDTLFGFIFGEEILVGNYTDHQQFYASSNSAYKRYGIPISLTKVTVTGGKLFYGAFYNCSNIKTLSLGNDVVVVGERAFYNCTSLETLFMGKNVSFEVDGLFSVSAAPSLKTVYYNGSIDDWLALSFTYCDSHPCCKGADLYFMGEKATEVIIPETVTAINKYAFYGCTSLKSVTIPDTVTVIGAASFKNCTNLSTVRLSENVLTIQEETFYMCESLASITIPNYVLNIKKNAFYKVSHLSFKDASRTWYIAPITGYYTETAIGTMTDANIAKYLIAGDATHWFYRKYQQ